MESSLYFGNYSGIFDKAISKEINDDGVFSHSVIMAAFMFNKTNLLGVYFAVSLINTIYLLLYSGIDISSSSEDIKKELSYFPGYDNSYGFNNKSNIGEILFSPELKISLFTIEYAINNHYQQLSD